MAATKGFIQFIGPTAALAGAPGPGNVWTYTHSQNRRALCIEVLNSQGQALPPSVAAVTQPSTSSIVVTCASAQASGVTLRIEWTEFSPTQAASLPGSVGVIS